jgi:hypothetical protein
MAQYADVNPQIICSSRCAYNILAEEVLNVQYKNPTVI